MKYGAIEETEIDVAVIGAGVMGLSIARSLARRGREVAIFDAEPHAASVTSSRNSGVIHAGLYYRPESLKALYCVAGRELLYQYAEEHDIPFKRCGKLVVATAKDQIGALHKLKANAERNGVSGIEVLSPAEAAKLEPQVSCHQALHVPESGMIDVHQFLLNLESDAVGAGAYLMLNTRVVKGDVAGNGLVIETEGAQTIRVKCNILINAAGLGAQEISGNLAGLDSGTIPEQELGKGNYFTIGGPPPFSRLIYPLPVPGTSGLHVRLDFDGRTIFGPDLEPVSAIDYNVGLDRRPFFEEAIGCYWRGLPPGELQPDYAGIRPKLVLPSDHPRYGDFMVQGPAQHRVCGLYALYGIESPGLTASLALGEAIAEVISPEAGKPHQQMIPKFPYRLT